MPGPIVRYEQRPRSRVLRDALAGVVLLVAAAFLLPWETSTGPLIPVLSTGAFGILLIRRELTRYTTIGDGHVTVRRGSKKRIIPLSDIDDVVLMTRWSPVRLRLHSHELIELPWVRPDDTQTVRQLVRLDTAGHGEDETHL